MKHLLVFAIIFISYCGTNTNVPVYPIYNLIAIASPSIVDIKPIEVQTNDNKIRMEFDIFYYVTNTEDEFIGYNLYITTSSISPDLVQAGIGLNPYLPSGYEPSFYHTKEEASTLFKDIKQKRIPNLKPSPSEIPFQICERYYFRLKAVLRNGIPAIPSAEISSCATPRNLQCPSTSPCYGFSY
ncbi:MAG: hypothetical protein ACK4UJ_03890 [Leptonema sp. (in: bacteria)]